MVIPPFTSVALVECRERIELTPLFWYREFVGYGRLDADELRPALESTFGPLFDAMTAGGTIWVVTAWRRFEDGREEPLRRHVLGAGATEADAKNALQDELEFMELSRSELEAIQGCFKATDEDRAYLETRFPDVVRPPDPRSLAEHDRYQAMLRVLAGLQPETVKLIRSANAAHDERSRLDFEKNAVNAFFADLAHYWSDDFVRRWQQSNPIGKEWMGLFSRVLERPKRELDPVDYELALNWLKRKYNLLTAAELAQSVFERTGKRLNPSAIKKRRERMGLTTDRTPGPRPNSEK